MRVCLVNQFYPPDLAPTGVKLEAAANALAARGHEVSIVCSRQHYAGPGAETTTYPSPERVRVLRVSSANSARGRLRWRVGEYAGFAWDCFWKLLRIQPRPDLIVVMSSPPFVGTVVALACRLRKVPLVQWVMDAYPQALFVANILRPNRPVGILLSWLMRRTVAQAHAVVTVGPAVADTLAALVGGKVQEWNPLTSDAKVSGRTRTVYWFSLWADDTVIRESPAAAVQEIRRSRGWRDQDLILLYSGNLGRGHVIRDFLEAIEPPAEGRPVRWVFAGEGARGPEVVRFHSAHPELPLEIQPYCSPAELPLHLRAADVHLVSLDPEWESVMLPSKLQNVFAAGRPVIFVGNPEGTMGRWVRDSGAGWCVKPGDRDALRRAVDAARDPASRRDMGRKATAFAQAHWNPADRVPAWVTWLEKLAQGGATG